MSWTNKSIEELESIVTLNNEIKKDKIIEEGMYHFVPNEKVISNVENDPCLYEVVEVLLPVGGVNLYNLKILTGNKNNPPGLIIHNIPETLLQHIKE